MDTHEHAMEKIAKATEVAAELGLDDLKAKLETLSAAIADDAEVMSNSPTMDAEAASVLKIETAKADVTAAFIANAGDIPEEHHDLARGVTRAVGQVLTTD